MCEHTRCDGEVFDDIVCINRLCYCKARAATESSRCACCVANWFIGKTVLFTCLPVCLPVCLPAMVFIHQLIQVLVDHP